MTRVVNHLSIASCLLTGPLRGVSYSLDDQAWDDPGLSVSLMTFLGKPQVQEKGETASLRSASKSKFTSAAWESSHLALTQSLRTSSIFEPTHGISRMPRNGRKSQGDSSLGLILRHSQRNEIQLAQRHLLLGVSQ